MTTFYAMPNAGDFYHWYNALHFVLVGLAGGFAVLAAMLQLNKHAEARRYTLIAVVLIVLDLFVLWAESSARWRFSHIWLFLTFNPGAPIWWGGIGLSAALAGGGLLLFKDRLGFLSRLPTAPLAWVLLLGSVVVLIYPGLALSVNETRPLWNPMMAPFFAVSAMLMVLGIATLLGSTWARPWMLLSAVATLLLAAIYPLTLGSAAFGLLLERGLVTYAIFAGLILVGDLLYRKPVATAALGVLGAVGLRWVLVITGQVQGPGL